MGSKGRGQNPYNAQQGQMKGGAHPTDPRINSPMSVLQNMYGARGTPGQGPSNPADPRLPNPGQVQSSMGNFYNQNPQMNPGAGNRLKGGSRFSNYKR